jgi:Isochorismatase family
MALTNESLHGSAPDKAGVALLLIDVINDLEFPEGEQLLKHARSMAHRLVDLKLRVKAAGIPVVYINDNFGRWQSNFTVQVKHCLQDGVRGKEIAELLVADEDDYFVLKPKHSGFFSTTLDILLESLGVRAVILAGIAGNICVLFTRLPVTRIVRLNMNPGNPPARLRGHLNGLAWFRAGEALSEPDRAVARREGRRPRIVRGHAASRR